MIRRCTVASERKASRALTRNGIGLTNLVVDEPYAITTCIYRYAEILRPLDGRQLVKDLLQGW